MNEKMLSIIIPVYNAKDYIEKCLDSIIKVSDESVEIIVVNDGSSDGSDKILESYKNNHDVIVISQKNAGVSAARNAGIERATGKYMTFVDADDLFYKMPEVANEHNSDMIIYNYIEIDNKDNKIKDVNIIKNVENVDTLKQAFVLGHDYNTCWSKIYRTDIIQENHILFPTDMKVGEDMLWFSEYLKYTNHIQCVDDYFYGYRQNEAGAMVTLRKELNPERNKDFTREIQIKKAIIEESGWEQSVEGGFYQKFADNLVAKINFAAKGSNDKKELEQSVNAFLNDIVINDILKKACYSKFVNSKRKIICFALRNRLFRKFYLATR